MPLAMAGNRLRKKTNAASGKSASSQDAWMMFRRRLTAGRPHRAATTAATAVSTRGTIRAVSDIVGHCTNRALHASHRCTGKRLLRRLEAVISIRLGPVEQIGMQHHVCNHDQTQKLPADQTERILARAANAGKSPNNAA